MKEADPLLDLLASERVVAYRPSFARMAGSVTAAVLLSQFLYWSYNDAAKRRGGWFWKTMEDIKEETGLSRREQDTARKALRSLGVLEEDKRGIPMKIWFRVDREALFGKLGKAASNPGGMRQDGCAEGPGNPGANRQATSESPAEKTERIPPETADEVRRLIRESMGL